MSGKNQTAIRNYLRKYPNRTVRQIAEYLFPDKDHRMRHTRSVLFSMPDVYISGWTRNDQDKWTAQWSAVIPPPSPPRPTK